MRSQGKENRAAESGYTLLGVILLIAILSVFLSIAVPKTIQEIQRDRELECLHRGQQYARAIRLFYRRTGNYPTDLAQLENTNNERFLRKRYLDPITNGEWRLVYQGEVRSDLLNQIGLFFGGQSAPANPVPMPSGVISGLAAAVPTPVFGFGGNGGVTQLLDPVTGQPASPSSNSKSQSLPGSQGVASAGTTGTSGTPLGNRPIVGVSSISTNKSIRVYKKQTHYNEWQFVYNPASDGIGGGGQPGLNGPSLLGSSPVPSTSSPVPQR